MEKNVATAGRAFAIVAAMVFLVACTTGGQSVDAPSPFELAAHSWIGASVDEMIAVWGEPTSLLNERARDGHGIAHWKSGGRGGFGMNLASSRRCAVDAYFLEDRVIRRVTVSGPRCDERYAKYLDELTR